MGDVVGDAVGRECKSMDFKVILDASEGAGFCIMTDVSCVERSAYNHNHSQNHLRHLVEGKLSRPCAE